jgi:hypothetical protein
MRLPKSPLRFLVLASLLLMAGAAPISPFQTASSPTDTPRYTDPTYKVSMAVPAFQPAKERIVIATFQGPPENGFASNVTLVVDPGATTRDEYIKAFGEQISETNPRYTLRHLDKPQVSGKDAAILEYDLSVGGRRLRFLQLAVFADDRVYILTCTASQDSYKNHEAEFRKCVDSFRLDK